MTRSKTEQPPAWRNRIVGEGEESPDKLMPNPKNWRVHSKQQREAVGGLLDQVGWVRQVIVNKTTGRLIDGHLRVEEARRRGELTIPVVYVELSPEEETVILASFDPLGAMAGRDDERRDALLNVAHSNSAALDAALRMKQPAPRQERVTSPRQIPTRKPAETAARLAPQSSTYALVFDDRDQQDHWFRFVRAISQRYAEMKTIGGRIDAYVQKEGMAACGQVADPLAATPAPWSNRIAGSGDVAPKDLIPNPRNWRTHSENQRAAVGGILAEVGWVQKVIVNQRTGNLVDGHLRVEEAIAAGAPTVPVVYVDLSQEEEDLVLLSLDPLGELAGRSKRMLADLLGDAKTNNAAVSDLFRALAVLPEDSAPKSGLVYVIAFDDAAQLDRWYAFARKLKTSYPAIESVGGRVEAVLKATGWA